MKINRQVKILNKTLIAALALLSWPSSASAHLVLNSQRVVTPAHAGVSFLTRFRHMAGMTLFAGFALLLCPSNAIAHLVTTGLGPVYDGIGHLVMTPEDLIPALAIALFAGLRGAAPGRRALFLLPLAWFAGGLLGVFLEGLPTFPVPAISFVILGLLVAADLKLSNMWVAAVVIVVGFVHGVLNGVALKQGAGVLGLIGIMATLFVLVALVSALIVSLKKPWTRIAVRVAGSWVAAIGMLMFGWLIRGQGL
jgi:hydrogenase/urease accessory protein HupE